MAKEKKILLTIDVEDWFQVENLRRWFPSSEWDRQSSRVESNTRRLLDLFDSFEYSIKVTFFVLGWVAEKHPKMVKAIQSYGHEIASHGKDHVLNNQMSEKRLKQDLETSKNRLEDLTGIEVKGYRAPNFSINDKILEIIQDCGYKYDSSYNSFDKHGRYGKINTKGYATKGIAIKSNHHFIELPVSNLKAMNLVVPWGGGGYFRLFPSKLFFSGIRQILKKQDAYLFYMHPWEIDPKQPRPPIVKGLSAWRHYNNLDKTYTRLSDMISEFKACSFMTCTQYLNSLGL